MSPEEAVERMIEATQASLITDDATLRDMLLKRGVPPFIADQLVVLVPLAFSRVHFNAIPTEKQYWNEFLMVDRQTQKEEQHRLDWNPFYCVAQARARKLAGGTAEDRHCLKMVAQHSAEYQAIDTILSQLPAGAVPEAVGTSPVTVPTDFPQYGGPAAYRSTVHFREAYCPEGPMAKTYALLINLVIDEEHPIEKEIRQINQCFLEWLGRRGATGRRLVIAFEAAPAWNDSIRERCEQLLLQDLGMDAITQNLMTDIFIIDPATKAETHFNLEWLRPES
jgi:hypothetical protein